MKTLRRVRAQIGVDLWGIDCAGLKHHPATWRHAFGISRWNVKILVRGFFAALVLLFSVSRLEGPVPVTLVDGGRAPDNPGGGLA